MDTMELMREVGQHARTLSTAPCGASALRRVRIRRHCLVARCSQNENLSQALTDADRNRDILQERIVLLEDQLRDKTAECQV